LKNNQSSFSILNKQVNSGINNEKRFPLESQLSENTNEEKKNEDKEPKKNDIKSYIESIKKRDYKAKFENESTKKRFFEKLNLYIR